MSVVGLEPTWLLSHTLDVTLWGFEPLPVVLVVFQVGLPGGVLLAKVMYEHFNDMLRSIELLFCATQVGILQARLFHMRIAQVRIAQVGIHQICAPQVGAKEICTIHVGVN